MDWMTCYKVLDVGAMAQVEFPTMAQKGKAIAALSLENKYDDQWILLYNDDAGSRLYIPQGLVTQHTRRVHGPLGKPVRFVGSLRDNQVPVVNSYLSHIQKYNGGIIKAVTGSGKTVMGISILATLGLKTLIIVPTEVIKGQWITSLKTFSDIKERNIGLVQGPTLRYKNNPVTIAMIQTLARRSKNSKGLKEFFDSFGLVIWDEVHTLGASTFSMTAKMFDTRYRLGLSATPRRKDGMGSVFFSHIGKVCNQSVLGDVVPVVYMLKYHGRDTTTEGCFWGGELNLGRYTNRVAKSGGRNDIIATALAKAYDRGRNILVLSDRLAQIQKLMTMVVEKGVEEGDIGVLTGSKRYGLDRRLIFGTYGCAGMGTDIPRLDTLMLATPRSDVEQPVGRILRTHGDKKTPLVLDIVDTSAAHMVNWAKARLKFYSKIGAQVSNW